MTQNTIQIKKNYITKILVLICLLILPLMSFSQKKDYIFFEIDNALDEKIDSLVFNSKGVVEYNGIFKIPKKRKLEFTIYINNIKYCVKIKTKSFGMFNSIISFELNNNNKNHVHINRGDSRTIKTIFSKKDNKFYWKLEIKVNLKLVKNNEFITGSETFDRAIKDNPSFFFGNSRSN